LGLFFNALNSLTADQLSTIIYIRNEGHTIVEAINRQLAHYPYHIGQIVFYAKMLKKVNGAVYLFLKTNPILIMPINFPKKKALRILPMTN